jgi:hypothetical protein
MKELKPVIFIQGDRQFYRENKYAQTLLLRAMSEGVTNPKELRKIAGLRTVADVYRTLDKLAIRKEYHEALARQGITMDEIVDEIRNISKNSSSDAIRLKGWQTILRSIGLDRYEKQEDAGKSWEEAIMEKIDSGTPMVEGEFEEYEVITPPVPESAQKETDKEKNIGKGLYEG